MLKVWWNDLKIWWLDFKRLSFVDWHWLVVWLGIYVSFILFDIMMPHFAGSALLKYIGIFLCLVYARQKYRKDYLLTAAIFFTFVADTILVWTDFEVLGVFIFCLAQLCHIIRLTHTRPKIIALYSIAVILIFLFAVYQGYLLPIYAITTIYAFLLCSNLYISRRNYRKHNHDFKARCAFYAFVAFICCDACVALRHLMLDGLISPQLLPLVAFFVWVFYYPSQVLMTNSSTQPESKSVRKIAKNTTIR